MKKVTPTAFLLLSLLVPITVVFGQIARRSQVPGAVANSATKAPNVRESTESTGAASKKTNSQAKKFYEKGAAFYESGKIDEAIAAFKQATKLQPDDPQNHYMLGMAYSKSKDYKGSFESFKSAIRYWPDWPEAHLRLGIMAYVLGRPGEAVSALNQLRRLESPLANSLSRIIGGDNKATPAEGGTASDPSLVESELVRAAASTKETPNPRLPDLNQAPSTKASVSKDASASLASSIKEPEPIASNPPAATEDASSLTGIYKVGVGDVLDIRVLNSSTTRSTLYTVIDGGLIDMAVAGGPITVGGLTTDVIQTLIAAELKRRAIVENARVSVGVRQYASHSVTITGMVNSPGTKFLRREAIPLYVLLAEAQARLDAGRAMIMRPGSSGVTMDLSDPATLNFLVRPGDMISITARPQEFYYIAGRIPYPGQKVFQPGVTLLQAILAAGGVMSQVDKGEISREGADRRLTTTTFKLKEIKAGKIQDPRLQPGDRIEIIR